MTETTRTQPAPITSPVRRAGLVTLPPLLMLYLGLGVVQIFLAGLGVFALDGEQLGDPGETAFDPHRFVALLMTAVAALVLVAVALARPGRRIAILALVVFLLVAVVQGVLAAAGEDTPLFGGLHAIFGIASLGVAGSALSATRARLQQSAAAEASSSA